MARKLHQQLGCYVPSFFEMHIDTFRSELTPKKLPLPDATVLFHEYMHFLQDIATYNGIKSIYIYSEYFRSVVNRVIKQSPFHVPYTIPDNADNVLLNLEIQRKTEGDSCDKNQLSICQIDSIEEELMPNNQLKSISSVVITDNDGDMFSFGSIAIMESAAYIMERLCSPNGVVDSHEFPYRSAELVADYFVAGFSDNLEMVLALCDMSLQSSNPGNTFVNVMSGIKNGDISFKIPEDIYDYFYDMPATVVGQGAYNMMDAFELLLQTTKDSLDSYLIIPGSDTQYHRWIDRIVEFSLNWRKNDRYYLLSMARHNDLLTNNMWGYAIKIVGSPLMSNNNGEYFKIPPDGHPVGMDVEFFKALSAVESLFSMGIVSCNMRQFCSLPLSNVVVDDNCDQSPWLRCQQTQLCPYALIWRHWGLSGHYPSV